MRLTGGEIYRAKPVGNLQKADTIPLLIINASGS
jgi:hypothetical protein